ncbi:hypothetical protein [Salimicrobium flavidum]|uniref:Uncharacterized protein n=1 Tax=Salimicrobium flavidum TaxID=570947 RepID=A0A1N7JAC0_9BACI|nr:hypothetical protein [Salimicrobium flavidum]SIS46302.1 hypothetical protein SAMN05421687_104271 [Salimicrobium flavidum]
MFSERQKGEIARVSCQLESLHYSYGPGTLIARKNVLEFQPSSTSIAATNDSFSFEKMTPIQADEPKGLRRILRMVFFTGFRGAFMYEGERYSIVQVTDEKKDFERFVETVNRHIKETE